MRQSSATGERTRPERPISVRPTSLRRSRLSSGLIVAALIVAGPAVTTAAAEAVNGGTAWTVGQNGQGQLGSGDKIDRKTFGRVAGLTNVAQVDGGRDHSIALDDGGSVWTWGNGNFGSLGLGTATDRVVATKVPGLTGVRQVETGHYHSLALLGNGTVRAWGGNEFGQVGDGTTTNRLSPVRVGTATNPLAGVADIAGGRDFSLARKSTGTVWAWGGGANGELGNGTTPVSRPTPGRVSGLTGVTAVAGGRNHALALKADGTVWAWGLNSSGQLGDGTRTNRSVPVRVQGLSSVVSIAAGAVHSVAVRSDGRAWTWGEGGYGQLGSGSRIDRLLAAPVSGMARTLVAEADSGRDHTLLVTRSGDLWTFGRGENGQLGDGGAGSRLVPFHVPGLTDVIDAGGGHGYTVILRAPGA